MIRQCSRHARQRASHRATGGDATTRDRLEHLDVRSFEIDHVVALWHLNCNLATLLQQLAFPHTTCAVAHRDRALRSFHLFLTSPSLGRRSGRDSCLGNTFCSIQSPFKPAA
jgi:hypothetical protein